MPHRRCLATSGRTRTKNLLLLCACIAASSVAYGANLPATIDADMTLTAAESPWRMRSHVTITAGAAVTVEPGVRVIADGDFMLTVAGSLTAMCPAGQRIVFRAPSNDSTGAWRGIYFAPGSTGRFQRCTFRSAETNLAVNGADVRLYNCHLRRASQDGLMAWGDAFIKTAYCRFQNNLRNGLRLLTDRPRGAIIFSEFVGNGEHPVHVKATCMEMLRRGNTFEYNGVEAIGLDCDAAIDIEDTDCWRDQDLPLDMTVGSASAELLIAEGATLRIKSDIRIYPPRRIVVRGKLLLDGLSGAPVVIGPQGDAEPGSWLGIAMEPGSVVRGDVATIGFAEDAFNVDDANLYLANVLIRDCSRNGVFGGGAAHVDLAHCTISACGRNGLALPQPTSSAKIHSTRVVECGSYPVRLAATLAEALRHGNSWRDNAIQAVGVVCAQDVDISDDDLWQAQGIPFDLTADPDRTTLRIGRRGRLSLREGVEVLGGTVSADGILVAAGRSGNPVVFDAATAPPAPGDWTGIEFAPRSAGRLVNTIVRNAEIGVNVQSDGWIQLRDTVVHDCSQDGIRAAREAVPLITGCEVRDNARWGVSVYHNAEPLLGAAGVAENPGRNTFAGNGEYDLANQTDHAIVAQNNWWGASSQAAIGSRILDRSEDGTLGPVNFTPFLASAPAGVASVASSAPLAIMSAAAMSTGHGAAIHVALSRPANVRLTVRNIAGRAVQRLGAQVDTRAIVPWDRRDLRGSRAPSGRYLVEVEAFSEDGERSTALTALTLR